MSFLIKVVIVLVAIVGLYYLVSPYQNCVRDNAVGDTERYQVSEWCQKNTSW